VIALRLALQLEQVPCLPDALVTGYFMGSPTHWDYFRPWIAMAAAHVKAAPAIIKRNGFTADFSDFAIAIP